MELRDLLETVLSLPAWGVVIVGFFVLPIEWWLCLAATWIVLLLS